MQLRLRPLLPCKSAAQERLQPRTPHIECPAALSSIGIDDLMRNLDYSEFQALPEINSGTGEQLGSSGRLVLASSRITAERLAELRNRRPLVGQAATPNSRPTRAVTVIASAPQKVTLTAPTMIDAPPVRAASMPSRARKTSEATATTVIC